MKPISILALFVAFPIVILAYFNYANIIPIVIMQDKFSLSLAYIMLFVFTEGVIAGLLFLCGFLLESNFKLKEYQRKLEKTSVNADSDSSRVTVLESKIEVLEKALKNALEQNN